MKAVVLAGGKGRRLEPYTTLLPKPLMPVGEFPVLEILIRQLKRYGFDKIYLAVGHLAGLIEAYFQGGKKWGVEIEYSIEQESLGTVGPLNLIKDKLSDTSFLVLNGDILTDLNFSEFLEFHKNKGGIMTIGVVHRFVNVDFGVLDIANQKVVGFQEKPVLEYPVSMGIYAMNPGVFNYIPENKKFDLPDLVLELLRNGEDVFVYEYRGFWLDIGREDDFRRAQEEFKKRKDSIL